MDRWSVARRLLAARMDRGMGGDWMACGERIDADTSARTRVYMYALLSGRPNDLGGGWRMSQMQASLMTDRELEHWIGRAILVALRP